MHHCVSLARKAANSATKHFRHFLQLLPMLALITAFPQQMQAKELHFFNYRSVFDSKESFEAAKRDIREIFENSKDIQSKIKSNPKLGKVIAGKAQVRNSALAMCIDWGQFFRNARRTGADVALAIKSWGYSFEYVAENYARVKSVEWCKKSGANAGCDCEVLLVNGKIVITEDAGTAWKFYKDTTEYASEQLDFNSKRKKSTPSDTPNLSVASCKAATKKDASGKLVWDTNPSLAPLVEELKNSKIYCGVKAKTTNNNAQTYDKLSEQFLALEEIDRRNIQLRLTELGLYSNDIDGMMGAATRTAVQEFARNQNEFDLADTAGANSILQQILNLEPTTLTAEQRSKDKAADFNYKSVEEAKMLLSDVESFVKLSPDVFDPLQLAKLYTPAKDEVSRAQHLSTGSKYLNLHDYVFKNAYFREFHTKKFTERKAKETSEKELIQEYIVGIMQVFKDRIAANPLAPDAFDLMGVVEKFKGPFDPEKLSLDDFQKLKASVSKEAKRYDVASIEKPGAKSLKKVEKPKSQSFDKYESLNDIGEHDLALFINLGPDAPHAYKDLNGKTQFENEDIILCSPRYRNLSLGYRTYVYNQLKSSLNQPFNLSIRQSCKIGINGIDAIMVSGQDLGKAMSIPPLDIINSDIATGNLARETTIRWEDFKQERTKFQVLSDQYATDILSGARSGFGGISFKNGSGIACIVLDENYREAAHQPTLSAIFDTHAIMIDRNIQEKILTDEAEAFRSAQKNRCELVYSSSEKLKKIMNASSAVGLDFVVIPEWLSNQKLAQNISEIENAIKKEQSDSAQRLIQAQQRAAEYEAKQEARRQQLEYQQSQFRSKFGAKVNSRTSEIASQVKQYFSKIDAALAARKGLQPSVDGGSFYAPVPQWYSDKRLKGWKIDSIIETPNDYGVAKWDNRSIEALIIDITINMKNDDLGKYDNTCWTIALIDDKEFGRLRSPNIHKCGDQLSENDWMNMHSFETKWDLGVEN